MVLRGTRAGPPKMERMSPQPQDLRPGRPDPPDRPTGPKLPGNPVGGEQSWRWVLAVLGVLIVLALLLSPLFGGKQSEQLTYSDLIAKANEGAVETAEVDNTTGRIH